MTEITVWINGREKRVSGVTRSTTCRDVVTILLWDHLKADEILPSYCHCFSLFERWRGCERILSPRTRLYKLWKAWGQEQKNVRFTLKKSTSGEPHPEEIGDELIGRGSRKSMPNNRNVEKCPIPVEDNKKRVRNSIVRPLKVSDKSHRKTDDSSVSVRKKERGRKSDSNNQNHDEHVEDLDTLVQTVVKQSKRLQDLLEKVREIDSEIEFYETKAHILRIEEHGKNYVQEAYLKSRLGESSQSDDADDNLCELVTNGCSDLEAYISLYESLLNVESQLSAKRGVIAKLTGNIERSRLNLKCNLIAECSRDRPGGASGNHTASNDKLVNHKKIPLVTDDEKHLADHQREIGLVRAQLEWYTDVCIAQRSEITTMHNQLASAETLYNDKFHWLDILLTELERLEISSLMETPSTVEENSATPQTNVHDSVTEECDPNDHEESKLDDGHDSGISLSPDDTSKLQCRIGIDNDSSSDTGLSSLHSQDDIENLPVVTETVV